MAGSGTKLYILPQAELSLICSALAAEALPHLAVYQQEELVAIGISPSISDQLVADTLK